MRRQQILQNLCISALLLTVFTAVKSKVEILHTFVAFSEYINEGVIEYMNFMITNGHLRLEIIHGSSECGVNFYKGQH